jgi:hypothetical protein
MLLTKKIVLQPVIKLDSQIYQPAKYFYLVPRLRKLFCTPNNLLIFCVNHTIKLLVHHQVRAYMQMMHAK